MEPDASHRWAMHNVERMLTRASIVLLVSFILYMCSIIRDAPSRELVALYEGYDEDEDDDMT